MNAVEPRLGLDRMQSRGCTARGPRGRRPRITAAPSRRRLTKSSNNCSEAAHDPVLHNVRYPRRGLAFHDAAERSNRDKRIRIIT